ncbi:MAG TPA: metallopeptidase TldD-related protein [Bryobacteraceae bacterium]|nr:metallopeptidase TldD-related protein [Bryobacteraceae bacterium]
MNLEDLASQVVQLAGSGGASGVECTVSEGEHFSAGIRMGEVESLKESGARRAGVRVMVGKHTGSAYTSDLTAEGIRQMVSSALELAKITTEDPYAGLPEESELGRISADLELYSDSVPALEAGTKIEWAKRAEAAALAADPRIANSEGASCDTHVGTSVFANSLGFLGRYRTSSCSISAVPVAKQNGSMERDFWYSVSRSADGLESPEDVGRRAAERALRRLGARKVATQKVPVVFEARVARTLLDNIFDAVSGDSVYRGETFLDGKLGQKIGSEKLTVIDDATIPKLFGSSPFDDEGVPSRRTVVIENGVLRSWLLNSYTARKLGMKTTGNASRGITGNAGVGHGNFYIPNGTVAPADIVKSVKSGLYVTELIGFGVNVVTGDYSRGAAGLWIENGEFTHPVSEITIASTLQDMLANLEVIGSDLEFRAALASPALLISEMTISGQ